MTEKEEVAPTDAPKDRGDTAVQQLPKTSAEELDMLADTINPNADTIAVAGTGDPRGEITQAYVGPEAQVIIPNTESTDSPASSQKPSEGE